ncbi:glycosyltransferase family 4 protein [Halobacillus rhizosphaerae]|uniref:glycosyltransferase family 4 protein n=1 Tax=Halobacillus rhizosphaerae TaxID=3064889 RepID=UPI00398B9E0E
MKIVYINTLYHPNSVGGAAKSVELLVEEALKNNHTPIIITLTDKSDYIEYVANVKIYYINHSNIYWLKNADGKKNILKLFWHIIDMYNPFIYLKLIKILKVEKPNVINTNNIAGFSIAPWLAGKKLKIPMVHTIRDYNLLCAKGTMYRKNENCDKRCISCRSLTYFKKMKSNINYVNHVTGISQYVIEKHEKFGYFKNVRSTHIPNVTSDFKFLGKSLEKKRNLRILYLGRIEKEKGITRVIEVINKFKEVELYLGGTIHDTNVKKNIEEKKYNENIKFLGYVNPVDILPEIDILIVPSLWEEPFGRVVIEAYQFGKPVIGTYRGGISELILNGVTGFLYHPENNEELKNIINNILKDKSILETMTENIQKNFASTYNSKIINKRYFNLYLEVANLKNNDKEY